MWWFLDHHNYRPLIHRVIAFGDPTSLLLIPTLEGRIKLHLKPYLLVDRVALETGHNLGLANPYGYF
ncbi:MAG: hypothetical protein ACREQW_13895 [Candidatus Binatia bacterium]